MSVPDVILAFAAALLGVWCFMLDRALSKVLKRQAEDETRRLRRAGL